MGTLQTLNSLFTGFIQTHGLFGIFALMIAESALIPIPSEVTMTFAGFMAGLGYINFWQAVLIGTFGNLLGSLISYYLGYFKGESWVRSAIRKWGKWLLIREEEFDKAKDWFVRYGNAISFFSRLMPIVRTFISLPAGIARIGVVKFSIYTFAGSFIWSWFLAWLGLKLGQNWTAVEPYFRKFQFLILGVFVVLGIFYIKSHLKKLNNQQ